MFQRRKTKKKRAADPIPPHHVTVDDLLGDPLARDFVNELKAGQWHRFAEYMETCRGYWDARAFYLNRIAGESCVGPWVETWIRERPTSSAALCLRGQLLIVQAWEVRGSGRANTVGQDSWPRFMALLERAEADFARSAELDPWDPTPHSTSLWSGIGLQVGTEELVRRYNLVVERNPWDIAAHHSMVQGLARKWGGSAAHMHGFVREVVGALPDGHPLHALACHAHLESWLDLGPRPQPGVEQKTYFHQPAVVREINEAAGRYLHSSNAQPNLTLREDRNFFALCFALMGDRVAQLEQMKHLGDSISTKPWALQGAPADKYAMHRHRAQLQVRGNAA